MLVKYLFLSLSLIFVFNVNGDSDLEIVTIDYFMKNNCDEYKLVGGKKYCIKKSTITLNSCGPQSDWPCMEESGCLTINKFISNAD